METKLETINNQFQSESNISYLASVLTMNKTKVRKLASNYLTSNIIEKANFYLPAINQLFVNYVQNKDFNPLANEIKTRDDSDMINYEAMSIRKPYKNDDADFNMFDLMKR